MKSSSVRLSKRGLSRNMKPALALAAAWAAASLFGAQSASAQSPVNNWIGPASPTVGLWFDVANWDTIGEPDSVPTISGARADDVFFGTTAVSIDLGVSPLAGRLNFNNPAGITFSGNSSGNGVSLRHGILMDANSPAITIPGSTNLNGTGQSYINNSANLLTIGSNVSNLNNTSNVTFTVDGTGPITITTGLNNSGGATTHLVKNGTGRFELSNSTFLGSSTLNAGRLVLRGSNALGASGTAATFTINGGSVGSINAIRTVPATKSVVVNADFGLGGEEGFQTIFNGTVDLTAANRTLTVGLGGGTFGGVVSNGGITKAGPSALVLTNAGNTYAGGTTVNSGAVIVTNNTAVPNMFTGGLTVNAGGGFGVRIGTDSVILTDPDIDAIRDSAVIFNGPGKDFALEATSAGAPAATPVTYSDVIGDVSGSRGLQKHGAGSIVLSGVNTYSGNTTINQGSLIVGAQNNLGDGSATNNIVFTGGSNLRTSASLGDITKSITLTQAVGIVATIDTQGFDSSISGTIIGAPGTGTFRKSGAGTLTLSGNNTYTGRTTIIGAGVLRVVSNNALGSAAGDLFISGGSTTDVDSSLSIDGTAGDLTLAEPIVMEGKTAGTLTPHVRNVAGNNTITAPMNMDAAGTWFTIQSDAGSLSVAGVNNSTGNATARLLQLRGAASGEITGPVQNTTGTGPFSVTKHDAGTWTLSGNNTYTGGTTVNAGTLQVSKMHAGNPVTVAAGATLRVLESSPGVSSGHPAGDNAFVSTPSTLTIDAAGFVDITNNDIVVDYSGASPIATYEQLVRTAYNIVGDWQGPGITSSIAANDGNYVVAIADNATLAAPFGTAQGGPLFSGVDVDLDTILVKFTHRADINLDGLITPDDSAVFGGNYDENQPAVWATGDMNYDGIFTPDDAAIFGGAYDESLASLPEPVIMGPLGLAALALVRRRRN